MKRDLPSLRTKALGFPALVVLLLALLSPAPAPAQDSATKDLVFSLVTILPGDSLYSAFGHTALRIVDTRGGEDILFNYGLSARPFDFSFVLSMLGGRMDFMVAAMDSQRAFEFYRDVEKRGIVEQSLDISPEQKSAILAVMGRDMRPENRVYNYHYFQDNCATRLWRILSPLGMDPPAGPKGAERPTLRQSIEGVLGRASWLGLATDLLMGPRTDRPLAASYPHFLPQEMMDWASATLRAPRADRNLVASRQVLYEAPPRPQGALSPLLAVLGLLALALSLFLLPPRLKVLGLAYDIFLFSLSAIAGLGILVIWLSAGYAEAGWNLNLLWAGPFPLLALLLGRPKRTWSLGIFRLVSLSALALGLWGGLGIQSLPWELRLLSLALALRAGHRGEILSWPPLAYLHLHIVSFANRWRSDPQN